MGFQTALILEASGFPIPHAQRHGIFGAGCAECGTFENIVRLVSVEDGDHVVGQKQKGCGLP